MRPEKIAYVTYGANHRRFAFIKEDPMSKPIELTLDKIERAYALLGDLIPIFKSDGAMDNAAATFVADKLDTIADLITPPAAAVEPSASQSDSTSSAATLQSVAADLRKQLESLSAHAMATDYSLGDRVDAMVDIAKNLEQMAAVQPVATPAPMPNTPSTVVDEPTEEPAVDAAVVDAGTADASLGAESTAEVSHAGSAADLATDAGSAEAPADASGTVDVPATVEAAVAPVAAAAPMAEVATPPAEPAAAMTPDAASLTKADFQAMLSTAMAEMSKTLFGAVEQRIAKALQPHAGMPAVPSASNPAALQRTLIEPKAAYDPLEELDLTRSPDLANVNEYGHWMGPK